MVRLGQLKNRYERFMSGKDGKSLEDNLIFRLDQIDELIEENAANERNIDAIFRKMKYNFQKYSLVKYDAFQEMGGKLSFSLAMLNEKNDGYIINAVHSREGCYTYVKEIIDGNSIIDLGGRGRAGFKASVGFKSIIWRMGWNAQLSTIHWIFRYNEGKAG